MRWDDASRDRSPLQGACSACVRFAQTVPNLDGKLSLLNIAGRWLALAEEAEKRPPT